VAPRRLPSSLGTLQVTDAPCILLAGVGFEAEVVQVASRGLKDALGAAAYIVAGGVKLIQGRANFKAKVGAGAGWGGAGAPFQQK
jgi:diacylglycerol kinase family enzyme